MKSAWLHQQHQDRLIIFCSGWGMDANPFLPLSAKQFDVLMLFDYGDPDLDFDVEILARHYPCIFLVSWSMGVWVGQQIFRSWSHLFQRTIAINGTLCPIHDQLGIPVQLYTATVEQFSVSTRLKFYRRMCRQQSLETFLENQPQRSVESQSLELAALQGQVGCQDAGETIYSQVFIASHDLVIPTANQLTFWQGRKVCRIKGSHFLFYNWQSWDELMACADEHNRE